MNIITDWMPQPQPHISVVVTYRNETQEKFQCTDFPAITDRWVTLYNNLNRKMILLDNIQGIEYDVRDTPLRTTATKVNKIGFRTRK